MKKYIVTKDKFRDRWYVMQQDGYILFTGSRYECLKKREKLLHNSRMGV